MKALDVFLRRWRVRLASEHVRSGDRLLDIGCFDRTLIDGVADRITSAVGVDAEVVPTVDGAIRLERGRFPDDFDFPKESFDCIAALAVLEHVAQPDAFAGACAEALAPGGRLVLTVPHPFVDRILDVLMAVGIADGMAAEQHHGFDVAETVPLFAKTGLRLEREERFQLGLNRLFVFTKPAG